MGKIKINQVIISGYVPRDTYVNEKRSFLSFSCGVDDSWFNNTENKWVNNTSWINVKLNAKEDRINALAAKLVKGANVIVTGQLKQDSYPDKNGNTVNDVYIRATQIQFLDEGSGSSNNNSNAGVNQEPNMDFMNDMQLDPYKV